MDIPVLASSQYLVGSCLVEKNWNMLDHLLGIINNSTEHTYPLDRMSILGYIFQRAKNLTNHTRHVLEN